MTDKQIPNERRLYEYKSIYPEKSIIIDGVDVSGCKWFTHNQLCECAIKPADDFHCHANPNCYYKKWQHKEQECEEFRKANDEKNELLAKLGCPTIATARRKVLCLQEQIDKLESKNEELKKSKTATEEASELFVKNADQIARVLENKLDQFKADNDNLKQYKSLFEKTRDLWNEARMNNYELLKEIKDLKDNIRRTIWQSEYYKHQEAEKFKQNLIEIKEIAEKYNNTHLGEQQYCCKDILQKIREIMPDEKV